MDDSTRWRSGTKQLIATALLVVTGLLLYRFRTLLAPLIIAFLFSYLFAPAVGWLSRALHVRRGWATALLYLVGLGLLATTPAIVVPTVANEVQELGLDLNAIVNRVIRTIDRLDEIVLFGYVFDLPELDLPTFNFQDTMNLVDSTISPIAGGAFTIVKSVASGVGWLFFIAVISFYMLMDAERIGPALVTLIPTPYRGEVAKLGAQLSETWNAFLRGQLVLCAIIGVITWIAMAAIGIKYSVALGIVAGVLELIPNIGPFVASIPAILLALFQGSSYIGLSNLGVAILVAVIYILIQNLENNLLVPRIIGASLNLHPLIVIIGVLAGATLANILGALLAAPVMASLRDIIRYVYCKLADLDPFPPPPSFFSRLQERDVRAFLFDLDGTLLDSDDMAVERWATRLRPVAFLDKVYDSRRLARRLIMALETPVNFAITVLDLVGLDNVVLSMSDWLRRVCAQRAPHRYMAIDGTVDMVKALSRDYALGIVTTRNRDDARRFLSKFELEETFQVVVSRRDVKRLKPHPEPIRYACQQLGYAPEQCVMVGDTTVDIKAGKKANALTVGVLCGFGERPELERLEPDLILESTAQLTEYLRAV